MRKVFRLLIHAEQQRLKRLWRQHEADVERWFPSLRPSPSSTSEDTCAPDDACTRTTKPGHHDGNSRARLTPVKALRFAPTPQSGAHGLDRDSVEPSLGTHVMAQETAGLTNTPTDRKEVAHAGDRIHPQHRGDDRRPGTRLSRVRHHR